MTYAKDYNLFFIALPSKILPITTTIILESMGRIVVARLRWRIWVLSLIALLFLALAVQAQPSRVVPAEEILKKIELGQPVEYDNCVIVGDLNVSALNLTKVAVQRTDDEKKFSLSDYEMIVASPIRINFSSIIGPVDFRGVRFNQKVDFRGVWFNQKVDFRVAFFSKEVDFSDSQFSKEVKFRYSQFNQPAFFRGVQFRNVGLFSKVQFNHKADFGGASFSNYTEFDDVRFNHEANFWGARFELTGFFRNVQFNQSTNFSRAEFVREAHFEDAKFSRNLFFDNSQFSKEAFFDGASIKGTLSLYRTKYEKLNIRWSSITDLAYDDTAYYLLIENFKKQGFTDDVNDCYYSYRCKHREELFRQGKFDKWLFDFLAWATYGYGLRPVWPLGWSVLFILLGGAFFSVTKSISRSKGPEPSAKRLRAIRKNDSQERVGDVSFWEALLLSTTYFTSGASAIISSVPQEFSPLGKSRYVVVILRLLGWIFFVLFLTSLGKIA